MSRLDCPWSTSTGWILAQGRTRSQSITLEPLWEPRCFPVGSPGGYGHAGASAAITAAFASWAALSWSCWLQPRLPAQGEAGWELHQAALSSQASSCAASSSLHRVRGLGEVPRCCKSLSSSAVRGSKDSSPCCLRSLSVHEGGDRQWSALTFYYWSTLLPPALLFAGGSAMMS